MAAAAVTTTVNASTTVAVLELGKGGAVRQTSSPESTTTVEGVNSFWANLHSLRPRRYAIRQEPGMSLVPDMFNKPDGGIVIGVMGNGIDLSAMETVSAMLDPSSNSGVIGHMETKGSDAKALMRRSQITEDVDQFGAALKTSVEKITSENGKKYQTVALNMNDGSAAALDVADKQIASMIDSLRKEADASGSTFIVHIVAEGSPHSPHSRRLEDRDENENNSQDNEDGENNGSSGSLYYGYGYFLENGEYYTPYRTIFQIQYFNCVLWAGVGLVAITLYSISLTLNMPLMPDTLLFGASAKMMD